MIEQAFALGADAPEQAAGLPCMLVPASSNSPTAGHGWAQQPRWWYLRESGFRKGKNTRQQWGKIVWKIALWTQRWEKKVGKEVLGTGADSPAATWRGQQWIKWYWATDNTAAHGCSHSRARKRGRSGRGNCCWVTIIPIPLPCAPLVRAR